MGEVFGRQVDEFRLAIRSAGRGGHAPTALEGPDTLGTEGAFRPGGAGPVDEVD